MSQPLAMTERDKALYHLGAATMFRFVMRSARKHGFRFVTALDDKAQLARYEKFISRFMSELPSLPLTEEWLMELTEEETESNLLELLSENVKYIDNQEIYR